MVGGPVLCYMAVSMSLINPPIVAPSIIFRSTCIHAQQQRKLTEEKLQRQRFRQNQAIMIG